VALSSSVGQTTSSSSSSSSSTAGATAVPFTSASTPSDNVHSFNSFHSVPNSTSQSSLDGARSEGHSSDPVGGQGQGYHPLTSRGEGEGHSKLNSHSQRCGDLTSVGAADNHFKSSQGQPTKKEGQKSRSSSKPARGSILPDMWKVLTGEEGESEDSGEDLDGDLDLALDKVARRSLLSNSASGTNR
jgi:hypothetical protein